MDFNKENVENAVWYLREIIKYDGNILRNNNDIVYDEEMIARRAEYDLAKRVLRKIEGS